MTPKLTTNYLIAGFIMKLPIFDQDQLSEVDDLFEDAIFWNMPEEEHEHAQQYIVDKK